MAMAAIAAQRSVSVVGIGCTAFTVRPTKYAAAIVPTVMYITNWTRRRANGLRTSKAKSGGIKIADNKGKFTAKPHSRHSAVMTNIKRANEIVRGMDSLSKEHRFRPPSGIQARQA